MYAENITTHCYADYITTVEYPMVVLFQFTIKTNCLFLCVIFLTAHNVAKVAIGDFYLSHT